MKALDGLDPQALWRHFGEISRIPRESGNEAAIAGHVRTLASGLGLACTTDDAGNVIVKKPGTRGMPSLALQSHLDMVCEKDKSTPHDFSSDPIRLVRDGDWIRATGTTLGADNGIGVAAMLAIMEDTSLAHPDLELIFTVEEETGLTGAHALARESFSAHTLINLDSEDEGTFIIGCAGGVDTMLDLELDFMTVPEDTKALLLRIGGLRGVIRGWTSTGDWEMRSSSWPGSSTQPIPCTASAWALSAAAASTTPFRGMPKRSFMWNRPPSGSSCTRPCDGTTSSGENLNTSMTAWRSTWK